MERSCHSEGRHLSHRMVRGVPGHADGRGFCDPNGRQSSQEPAQQAKVDKRVSCSCGCYRVAVYAAWEVVAVYTAASTAIGRDSRFLP